MANSLTEEKILQDARNKQIQKTLYTIYEYGDWMLEEGKFDMTLESFLYDFGYDEEGDDEVKDKDPHIMFRNVKEAIELVRKQKHELPDI